MKERQNSVQPDDSKYIVEAQGRAPGVFIFMRILVAQGHHHAQLVILGSSETLFEFENARA